MEAFSFEVFFLAPGKVGQVVFVDLAQIVGFGAGRDMGPAGGQCDLFQQVLICF